ncbi:MAG: hypothetical protein WCI74_05570 [Actinomycetes bacterium]
MSTRIQTTIIAITVGATALITAGVGPADAAPSLSSDSARSTLRCDGRPATIVGRGGTVRGTNHADVIVLIRPSRVLAKGGNDVICGSSKADEIHGGPGDDRVFGGRGNDRIFGDSGDDLLNGGPGDDSLNGGAGDDLADGFDDHGVHVPGTDTSVSGTTDDGPHHSGTSGHHSGR